MFSYLLNPNGVEISSPHKKYSSHGTTNKQTHTVTTVMTFVHSKYFVECILPVLTPSFFFKNFALESARSTEP